IYSADTLSRQDETSVNNHLNADSQILWQSPDKSETGRVPPNTDSGDLPVIQEFRALAGGKACMVVLDLLGAASLRFSGCGFWLFHTCVSPNHKIPANSF
ncbi:MAG: hypothetical protein WB994_04280, partial [Candidatus Acidiferrum sp.]